MKRHLVNGLYGAVDYGSYPFGMLLVAPIVLHRLGPAEYGIWMISTAVISAGGIIASGFCDANIQRVARLRGTSVEEPGSAHASMLNVVRATMGINLVLGTLLALAVWLAAPYAALRITVASLTSAHECLICLRIASLLIVVRAIESVCVSTQRAFELYRDAVQVSVAVRLLTLASAALLVLAHQRVVAILAATAVFLITGTWLQFRQLWHLLDRRSLWPAFHPDETRTLIGTGIFAWAQALGGIIFGQLDRLILGVYLGALALAPYALCIQFAQPIFGLTASGLNFLFPYFASRTAAASPAEMKRLVLRSFACNLLIVVAGAALLLAFGPRLVRIWAGPAVAHSAAPLLAPVVIGSALMGLGVTGTYATQALGLFRTVACISLGGRTAVLFLMIYLLRHLGIHGLAIARVWYGLIALLVYLPLARALRPGRKEASITASTAEVGGMKREAAR